MGTVRGSGVRCRTRGRVYEGDIVRYVGWEYPTLQGHYGLVQWTGSGLYFIEWDGLPPEVRGYSAFNLFSDPARAGQGLTMLRHEIEVL
jgi:hypothetical protein